MYNYQLETFLRVADAGSFNQAAEQAYITPAGVHALCPEIKFQFIPFENTPENAREILKNMEQNIDVVAGIFDNTKLNVRDCPGFVW